MPPLLSTSSCAIARHGRGIHCEIVDLKDTLHRGSISSYFTVKNRKAKGHQLTYRALRQALAKTESLLAPPLARIYRPFLSRTRFIAVTGSCGKTTTKELVAAILRAQDDLHNSYKSNNRFFTVARTILEVKPRHRYCVVELGASGPGSLKESVALIRADIAIVTTIGTDHYSAFRGADAAANEKRRLVESLGPDGVALLNIDDPRVRAMADSCRGRVLNYGLAADADVRGEVCASSWPDRLTLRVVHGAEECLVKTQLLGAHLATSLLAAIATAVACNVSLRDAANAVSAVPPVFGRMSYETDDTEVSFIHDHFKAPHWTLGTVVSFLETARARQKILVIGTISDYPGSASSKYRAVAREALETVDHVVFTNHAAVKYFRNLQAEHPDRLHVVGDVRKAARLVNDLAVPGTLVFLKGSIRADHLERIAMHRRSAISCWRTSCGRDVFCHDCEYRDVVAAGDAEVQAGTTI